MQPQCINTKNFLEKIWKSFSKPTWKDGPGAENSLILFLLLDHIKLPPVALYSSRILLLFLEELKLWILSGRVLVWFSV